MNKMIRAIGTIFTGLWLAGCATNNEEPVFTNVAGLTDIEPSTSQATGASSDSSSPSSGGYSPYRQASLADVGRFNIGDQVLINFSGSGKEQLEPHDERIKEDGTITLPFIGQVKAAGKTPGELQKIIHTAYVPAYFRQLTVTVKPFEQFFYVGGQVRTPGRHPYSGEITVTKAIQAAGDFTDFAKITEVKLIRAGHPPVTIDCRKAKKNPALDLPVLPGDQIDVPTSYWGGGR